MVVAVWLLPGVRVESGEESLHWEVAALAGVGLGWAAVSMVVSPLAAAVRSRVGGQLLATTARALIINPFTAVLSAFFMGCLTAVFIVLTPPVFGAVNVLLTAWLLDGILSVDGFGWAVLCASVAWIASWPIYQSSQASVPSRWGTR